MTLSLLTQDAMGSPKLARSEGGGLSAFRHAPFGADKLAGVAVNIPGFNGQRRDPVSGSYHLGNGYRAYNPTLMRFNCPDNLSPFGHGGINSYAYCVGDPINRADPTGHISWQAGLGIGLGILGIIATAGAAAIAISAAGGIAAALSAASATSLATGAAGLVADVTGIASGAASESNPELSATLGWVSMGAGLLGAGVGAFKLIKSVKSKSKTVAISKGKTQLNRASESSLQRTPESPLNRASEGSLQRTPESPLHRASEGEQFPRFSAKAEAENFNRLLTEQSNEGQVITDLMQMSDLPSSKRSELLRRQNEFESSETILFGIVYSQVTAINNKLRDQISTEYRYLYFDGAKVYALKGPRFPVRNIRDSV